MPGHARLFRPCLVLRRWLRRRRLWLGRPRLRLGLRGSGRRSRAGLGPRLFCPRLSAWGLTSWRRCGPRALTASAARRVTLGIAVAAVAAIVVRASTAAVDGLRAVHRRSLRIVRAKSRTRVTAAFIAVLPATLRHLRDARPIALTGVDPRTARRSGVLRTIFGDEPATTILRRDAHRLAVGRRAACVTRAQRCDASARWCRIARSPRGIECAQRASATRGGIRGPPRNARPTGERDPRRVVHRQLGRATAV